MLDVKAPPRSELSAINGINERVVRYLEQLSIAAADATMLTGSGSPVGVVNANRSRLYMDLATGDVYKNTSPDYGNNSAWALL